MVHERHNDVGRLNSLFEICEDDVVESRKLSRKGVDVGLDCCDLRSRQLFGESCHDTAGWRLAEIVDVRFERKAEGRDPRLLESSCHRNHASDDMLRHAVVHLSCRANEASLVRHRADDEPGVDRDAVTADSRAGLQDIDARVVVRKFDELPDVNPQLCKMIDSSLAKAMLTSRRNSRRAWPSPRSRRR